MLQPVDAFLERLPKPFLVALGIALVMIIGGVNLLSLSAKHFMSLYLVPIALTGWYAGGMAGGGIALLSLMYGLLPALLSGGFPESWGEHVVSGSVFFIEAAFMARLRGKFDSLSRMATLDSLTGLPNAQAFFELMARETIECEGQNALTLVYVDLGGVDRVNRSLGHAAGDQMLCTIGQVIKQNMPRPDLIGRVGGTTFAMLLPHASAENVNATIRQLQTRLYEVRCKSLLAITFSISVMTCVEAPRTVAGLMHEAENHLQRSNTLHHDALNIVQIDSASALH
jgi:diguanylate cyclase (GGDEF)-like protein